MLLSTYDLGHQPFGLASPAAWLRDVGAHVTCIDLAVEPLRQEAIVAAELVALYVPMHTATRLAATIIPQLRALNPHAHLCCYGLYAPVNEAFLRSLGVSTILGGEFEQGLVALYQRLSAPSVSIVLDGQSESRISLARQSFVVPDRRGLPSLSAYAFLELRGEQRRVGYTEASRGCKHLCRHCPIVPVYNGQFRIVGREVVLADIRQQVAAGAQHITFGDPDFFNGPGHALPLVRALHAEFPDLTYDVTIKVEHLLRHVDALPTLRDTGCVLVTSAVEAVDDSILRIFDKRHTRADFVRAVGLLREVGLALNPTFVAFTPWTTPAGYADFLALIAELDLVEHVSPVQYAIRLLIPAGSKLLELPSVRALVGPFDAEALIYPWTHPDSQIDQLQQDVLRTVRSSQRRQESRRALFDSLWKLVATAHTSAWQSHAFEATRYVSQAPVPQLSEPWYC